MTFRVAFTAEGKREISVYVFLKKSAQMRIVPNSDFDDNAKLLDFLRN